MDLTQLANLGEFIGGVAVLVTLIYLAVQVRHTRVQQDNQLLSFALQTTYSATAPMFQTENMKLLETALADSAAISGPQRFAIHAMLSRQVAAIALLSRSKDEVALAMIAEYKSFFDAPGGRAWLEAYPNHRFKDLALAAFASIDDSESLL